jgi:ketosteroid isomerase-like protein
MSEENVEIVRRVMDAWNRRDLGAAAALVEPEVEVEVSIGSPIDGTYHGVEAGLGFLAELWSQFESYRSEMTECMPAGDQVYVGVLHVGTGKGSGAKVEMPGWAGLGFPLGQARQLEKPGVPE